MELGDYRNGLVWFFRSFIRLMFVVSTHFQTNGSGDWSHNWCLYSLWYSQAWLIFGHAPLNSCHFLALDWSSSFHAFPDKPLIRLISTLVDTVGTPYNTNVGVQKIPDRAIWKPMVAKRNNTNPWSWLRSQILVTQDSGQSHMSKQPASRDWPEQIAPLVHSSQTAWQLFNLGQSIEIRIPHLLGHAGQLHTKRISHIWLRFSVL